MLDKSGHHMFAIFIDSSNCCSDGKDLFKFGRIFTV